MESLEAVPLKKRSRHVCWILLALVIAVHYLPYGATYAIPHSDYLNVMTVINYLQSPGLFAGDKLTEVLAADSVRTAPIYFYGLAYPLSFVFPAKWVLLVVGFCITSLAGYFAGGRWKNWQHVLVAMTLVLVLLHVNVSPLEGNRRSFTAVFLVAYLSLVDRSGYPTKLFLVALASGIYPPVALVGVAFLGLRELIESVRQGNNHLSAAGKAAGFCLVFLAVLSPYLVNTLTGTDAYLSADLTRRVQVQFGTWSEVFDTVVTGEQSALFRERLNFELTLIFLTLVLLEWICLRRDFRFRSRYLLLMVVSLGLWLLAHLVHPLIYHPFKYTRLGLLVPLIFVFVENLPRLAGLLRRFLPSQPRLLVSVYGTVIVFTGGLVALLVKPAYFSFVLVAWVFSVTWWKFVLGLPLAAVPLFVLPKRFNQDLVRSAGTVLILLLILFFPHRHRPMDVSGVNLSVFEGMFEYLRGTEPGTVVAGPPGFYIDSIPAYAKRGRYASLHRKFIEFNCKRIRRFRGVYFSEPARIRAFLEREDVDYLLVDRRRRKNGAFTGSSDCLPSKTIGSVPEVDAYLEDASWNHGDRFYLLHRNRLPDGN